MSEEKHPALGNVLFGDAGYVGTTPVDYMVFESEEAIIEVASSSGVYSPATRDRYKTEGLTETVYTQIPNSTYGLLSYDNIAQEYETPDGTVTPFADREAYGPMHVLVEDYEILTASSCNPDSGSLKEVTEKACYYGSHSIDSSRTYLPDNDTFHDSYLIDFKCYSTEVEQCIDFFDDMQIDGEILAVDNIPKG